MSSTKITQDEVITRSKLLPGFPLIVSQILATIDNPEANLNELVGYIEHDPVIAARVLSLANVAATRIRQPSDVHDIHTATSLIGISSVREMALIGSLAGFAYDVAPTGISATFLEHSVAVGVCSEELVHYTTAQISTSVALVGGLLHDVGQLYLYCFNAGDFREVWRLALTHNIGIENAERERFGVDHSTIGAWLAEHWSLPANICAAIRYHHAPDFALDETLVPVVHVAEVLSNALDLGGRDENRVTTISARACQKLGLNWDDDVRSLFGRMDARSRHANALFQNTANAYGQAPRL